MQYYTYIKVMQLNAKEPVNVFHHYKVSRIVDGDGFFCL